MKKNENEKENEKERLIEPIRKIIKKMFEFSDHEFSDDIDFFDNKKPWYHEYTWTSDQQIKFFDWLSTELWTNGPFRRQCRVLKDRKQINEFVSNWHMFCMAVIDVEVGYDDKHGSDIQDSAKKEN